MSFQPLSPRFNGALTLAADLHRNQARKGTDIPYVSHLLAVASIALEFGANEDEAIAALLHDAVEDAPKELGDGAAVVVRRLIEFQFGQSVRELVDACTDADRRDEHGNKPPWTARKVAYVNAVGDKSSSECLVAVADKVHNARAILRDFLTHREKLWCRFNKEAGRDGTLGYYRGLADAFASRAVQLGDHRVLALTDVLTKVVGELEGAVGMKGVWPPVPREAQGTSSVDVR